MIIRIIRIRSGSTIQVYSEIKSIAVPISILVNHFILTVIH